MTPEREAQMREDFEAAWPGRSERARSVVEKATGVHKPRFENTFCSQCGGEFGPGDSGYSHCADHRKATGAQS